ELLKEKLEVVELDNGIDYRLRALQDTGVYFAPLDASTKAKAEKLYGVLTHGAQSHGEDIDVRGHKLHVAAAKGVARFTFDELCEKALGAEDYITLARAY